IHAVMRELGGELKPERIAELGHEVELGVQGSASPSDTFASTTGGMVYVEPDEELRALDTPDFEFVIGYDGKSAPTGEMVAMVRRLTQETEVANDVMRSIGKITRDGVESVQSGNLERTGQLMDLNHGLLEALGVCTSSLSSMVWAARDSGAYGAKLTGAGGGGCTVALSDPGKSRNIVAGVGTVADEVFNAEVGQGVRAE
ncbi:MAG: mevalonate kinase, partial [Halobacteria archaeon]|nr:mevalonate kinase [Halobacteria archaeon]